MKKPQLYEHQIVSDSTKIHRIISTHRPVFFCLQVWLNAKDYEFIGGYNADIFLYWKKVREAELKRGNYLPPIKQSKWEETLRKLIPKSIDTLYDNLIPLQFGSLSSLNSRTTDTSSIAENAKKEKKN